MPTPRELTRKLLKTAIAACEDKKANETVVLELDPVDSGLADYFLITSATNERQAVAIADEIELRLKREHGLYAHSVEGRRLGEWILLDYVDFVVHIFQAERRAFYDIERLRKSARKLTQAEFAAAAKKIIAKKQAKKPVKPAQKPAKTKTTSKPARKAAKKAPAKKSAAKKPARKIAAKKPLAKPTKAKTAKKAAKSAKKAKSRR